MNTALAFLEPPITDSDASPPSANVWDKTIELLDEFCVDCHIVIWERGTMNLVGHEYLIAVPIEKCAERLNGLSEDYQLQADYTSVGGYCETASVLPAAVTSIRPRELAWNRVPSQAENSNDLHRGESAIKWSQRDIEAVLRLFGSRHRMLNSQAIDLRPETV